MPRSPSCSDRKPPLADSSAATPTGSVSTQSSLARWQQARREADTAAAVGVGSDAGGSTEDGKCGAAAQPTTTSSLLPSIPRQQQQRSESGQGRQSTAFRRTGGDRYREARGEREATAAAVANPTSSHEVSFASSNDDGSAAITSTSPYRRTDATERSSPPSSKPRDGDVHSDPQQLSRRPPVDAQVMGSQWEARYMAEKIPRVRAEDAGQGGHLISPHRHTRGPQEGEEAAIDETTDLLAAFRAKEKEALDTRRGWLEAEARYRKEREAMEKQLASEKLARGKAEQDVEELLLSAHARLAPSSTPQGTSQLGGGGDKKLDPQQQQQRRSTGDIAHLTTVSEVDATAASDAFWQKMKEREERARAAARREFIQQSQQRLYAEQDKRAEAEKLAKEAERRMRLAEARAADQTEAVKTKQKDIDALKGVLSEKEVRISELESEVAVLKHQLNLRDKDKERERDQLVAKCADLKELVRLREEALEEQRDFTQNLLRELGLKDKDLLDRESINAGVKREITLMQEKHRTELDTLEAQARDREVALKQELEHHLTTMNALKAQCEDYKTRAGVAEAELAKQSGQHSLREREGENQRQRLQGQLADLGVEKRSLELQLERVSAAAGRYAKDYAATKESERQGRESLVRRYTAEITTLQEELDRVTVQRKRDQERGLQEILQLGQEVSALKEQNTRYEHLLNVLEHDKTHAMLLLSQARENNQLLLQDKRRLGAESASNPTLRATPSGRLSIVHEQSLTAAADAKDQRIAELEAVRADLKEKLSASNEQIRQMRMQQMQQSGKENGAFTDSRLRRDTEALRREREELSREVRHLQQQREVLERQQQQQQRVASTSPSTALTLTSSPASVSSIHASLANMVRLLEANAAVCNNGKDDAPEKREFYFKHQERDLLDNVLANCLAALDCLQGNWSGLPFYSEGESSFSQSGKRSDTGRHHHHRHQQHHHHGKSNHNALHLDNPGEERPQQQGTLSVRGQQQQPPPRLPQTNLLGKGAGTRAAAGAATERTELESEPCWEEQEEEDRHSVAFSSSTTHDGAKAALRGERPETLFPERTASASQTESREGSRTDGARKAADHEDEELFVPHHGDGILRYSPIPASLPQSSVSSPSPPYNNGNTNGSAGRPLRDGLFQNVHIMSDTRQTPTSAYPAVDINHPRRSTPPSQSSRRHQAM